MIACSRHAGCFKRPTGALATERKTPRDSPVRPAAKRLHLAHLSRLPDTAGSRQAGLASHSQVLFRVVGYLPGERTRASIRHDLRAGVAQASREETAATATGGCSRHRSYGDLSAVLPAAKADDEVIDRSMTLPAISACMAQDVDADVEWANSLRAGPVVGRHRPQAIDLSTRPSVIEGQVARYSGHSHVLSFKVRFRPPPTFARQFPKSATSLKPISAVNR